jgi:hypothetical protein
MWADGWIEHRPTAAGADYLEISWACSKGSAYKYQEEKQVTGDVYHLMLSFTFFNFASPLSGKVQELSMTN